MPQWRQTLGGRPAGGRERPPGQRFGDLDVNGFPAAESVSQVDLRKCGLRRSRERAGQPSQLPEIVEKSLRRAALWDEVRDKLNESAHALSGGQQQRLCIARGLAVNPEVLLLDEPCSALDPIATAKIEDLLVAIKDQCTIVIVTHNMQQAARVADNTGFFLLGG